MALPISEIRGVGEVVDRNRIMRERALWHGLEEMAKSPCIDVLEHGGITRPIITRGGKHHRSRLVGSDEERQIQHPSLEASGARASDEKSLARSRTWRRRTGRTWARTSRVNAS